MKVKLALATLTLAGVVSACTTAASYAPMSEAPVVLSSDVASDIAELELIGSTQTAEEIQAIADQDAPTEILVDPETGDFLAARSISPSQKTRSISWLTPGCSSTSACINAGGVPFGYTGTGRISLNHKQTTRVAAGDKLSTFWRSSTVGDFAKAYHVLTDKTPITVTALTRS